MNYTGTYHHPAYQNITIDILEGSLFAERTDAAWKVRLDFEHVSGEYFIAYADSISAPSLAFQEGLPAKFAVGSDGISQKFGLAAESEMGLQARIWFDRL